MYNISAVEKTYLPRIAVGMKAVTLELCEKRKSETFTAFLKSESCPDNRRVKLCE